MSAIQTDSIYLGSWVDRTQGSVYGATITLSHRSGAFLLPFLATFTTFVFAQLWSIIAFILYYVRSKNRPEDAMTHELQAILRNSGAAAASWHFFMQGSRWAGQTNNPRTRSLFWTGITLAFVAISGLASTFAGYTVSKASPNRRIQSQACGYLTTDYQTWVTDTLDAANYARVCYGTNPTSSAECKRYMKSKLTWTGTANASCPFQSGICSYGDHAAFAMSTDPIDSLTDLGINSLPSERLYLKKNVVCSSIREINHYRQERNSTLLSNLVYYEFGPVGLLNYTHIYNRLAQTSLVGYSLATQYSLAAAPSSWSPIPALNRTDADVSIVFISPNSVTYFHPNNDPIFETLPSITPSYSTYAPAYDVSTLACAEQYQVCNPRTITPGSNDAQGNCSPWLGYWQLLTQASLLNSTGTAPLWPQERARLTPAQIAIFMRITEPLLFTSIYNSIQTRRASALRLADTVNELYVQLSPLPDDYWTQEVSSWFEASLARLQYGVMDFVIGPSTSNATIAGSVNTRQTFDKETAKLCDQQITQTGDSTTTNFSVLGISVIFGIGIIIIVLSFSIEKLSTLLCRRFWPRKTYKLVAWLQDGFLDLHSRAFGDKDASDQGNMDDKQPKPNRQGKVLHFSASSPMAPAAPVPPAATSTTYTPLHTTSPGAARFYQDANRNYNDDYAYQTGKNNYTAEETAFVGHRTE